MDPKWMNIGKPATGMGRIPSNSIEVSIAINALDKEGKLLPLLNRMKIVCGEGGGTESSPALEKTFDPASSILSLGLASNEAIVVEAILSMAKRTRRMLLLRSV